MHTQPLDRGALKALRPKKRPGPSAVDRLHDANARTPNPENRFARTNVDRERIARSKCDGTNRQGRPVITEGNEGRAGIASFPDTAIPGSEQPMVLVARIDGDGSHPAVREAERADARPLNGCRVARSHGLRP